MKPPRPVLSSVASGAALLAVLVTSGSGGSSLGIVLFLVPALIAMYLMGCVVAGGAYLLGLPLLLIGSVKEWWGTHAWISWLIALVGVSASVFSRVIATPEVWFDDEGIGQLQYNSPPALLFGGILLMAFGLLWAPRRARAQLPDEAARLHGGPVDR